MTRERCADSGDSGRRVQLAGVRRRRRLAHGRRLRRLPREADRRRGASRTVVRGYCQRLSDRHRAGTPARSGCWHPGHRLLLTAIIENEARQPKEVREDVEAAHHEEIRLGGEQATRRTNVCYACSPSKGGLDGRPYRVAEAVFSCLTVGVALAGRSRRFRIGCILPEPGAPSDEGIPRDEGLLGVHGLVGAFCTIRSSNVKALKVGSKIFYFQEASKTALDSDTVIYVRARQRRNRPLPPSFTRPGSDCARSRTARESSPGSIRVHVSRPIRRFRTCGTGTGRTASNTARSGGESAGE